MPADDPGRAKAIEDEQQAAMLEVFHKARRHPQMKKARGRLYDETQVDDVVNSCVVEVAEWVAAEYPRKWTAMHPSDKAEWLRKAINRRVDAELSPGEHLLAPESVYRKDLRSSRLIISGRTATMDDGEDITDVDVALNYGTFDPTNPEDIVIARDFIKYCQEKDYVLRAAAAEAEARGSLLTQEELAQTLGVSQQTVSYHQRRASTHWYLDDTPLPEPRAAAKPAPKLMLVSAPEAEPEPEAATAAAPAKELAA